MNADGNMLWTVMWHKRGLETGSTLIPSVRARIAQGPEVSNKHVAQLCHTLQTIHKRFAHDIPLALIKFDKLIKRLTHAVTKGLLCALQPVLAS